MHVDPEAARVVFEAFSGEGIPRPVAMGLDVTERAKLTPDHLARLASRAGIERSADEAAGHGAGPAPATNPVVRYVEDALRFSM